MKNYIFALALVFAAAPVMAQRNHQQHRTAPSRPASRPASHGSFGGHSSFGGQNRTSGSHTYTRTSHTSTGGHTYTRTSHTSTGGRTYSGGHTYTRSGSYGGRTHSYSGGRYRGSHSGGFAGGGGHFRGSMRPSGIGHNRAWFDSQRWHEGPAWIHPRFNCYVGFAWNTMPTLYDTVWVYDPATGEYYEAYYYPDYGYYAWASNPLVAIGVYTPSISIVVGG